MKISIICSDPSHPIIIELNKWVESNKIFHKINLVNSTTQLIPGDILFLISCSEKISKEIRSNYSATLVLHASDLPDGKGWSPHIWEISEGAEHITLTLLEAAEKIDTGKIWAKTKIPIPKDSLWNEINALLFSNELNLMEFAIKNFTKITPIEQVELKEVRFHGKRTPGDSKLDPNLTINELFNKIRVCDPNRFPAFFELHGKKYKLTLEKINA